MLFAPRPATAPPFEAAAALPEQLIEDASGNDIFRPRNDAVKAARVLAEVKPALAFVLPAEQPVRSLGFRWLWLATALGILAGCALTVVLMRTVWAPAFECHSYADHKFTCTRSGR